MHHFRVYTLERGRCNLAEWREKLPDLEPRLTEARGTGVAEGIASDQGRGRAHWRTHVEWLKLSFASDSRGATKIENRPQRRRFPRQTSMVPSNLR